MNSIRYPRRRPRVESVSFRGFFWVLVREAAVRIIHPSSMGTPAERAARLAVNSGSTFQIRSTAVACLAYHPERETWVPRSESHPFAVPLDFDFWSIERAVPPIVQGVIDDATRAREQLMGAGPSPAEHPTA